MFNFGFLELIVLGVLALLVIGPKQLPEVARVVGRVLSELRRATDDLTGSFHQGKKNFEQEIKSNTTDLLEDEYQEAPKEVQAELPSSDVVSEAKDKKDD